ncbi:MAG: ATP-grasp domain-containing protein, partial [Steroidobacteraceae bacterium]
MNLHEYQAKQLFSDYAIPVPQGGLAHDRGEAVAAAKAIGGQVWVVKAQVHAGGRGKAGGVKLCRSREEVRAAAAGMLGGRLKTKQTVGEGLPINLVYVESGSQIARELYLSLLLNRDRSRIAF